MQSIFFFLRLFAFSLILSNCQPVQSDSLLIATSANMQFAMGKLSDKFQEDTGIQTELIISSSGKLTAQIEAGAPYDVFVSADMKYPRQLFKLALAPQAPQVYARGKLVLWTMNPKIQPSLEILNDPKINHIALANPQTAPYGQAAQEVLERAGLYEEVKNKLVFGESIGQCNQFIASQSAEIGFTALSVVLSPTMKKQGQYLLLDTKTYSPIEQGIILLGKEGIRHHSAQKFYEFIFSPPAQEILKDYGYSLPN